MNDAVQFRINGAVLEYRAIRIVDGLIRCAGYTEWRPVPTVKLATSDSVPSSYDCGTRRT